MGDLYPGRYAYRREGQCRTAARQERSDRARVNGRRVLRRVLSGTTNPDFDGRTGRFLHVASYLVYNRTRRSRSELPTTERELRVMAALAQIGLIRRPKN